MADVGSLLRPGVLAGVDVAVAAAPGGGDPGPYAAAVAAGCRELGAEVRAVEVDPFGEPPAEAPAGVLVWDGAGAFAAGRGVDAVRAALDGAWLAVRSGTRMEGGKVVLVGPPDGDEHAAAARAGLENLARTLSIEWARHGVRPVAVLPGEPAAVAAMAAYLASPAGDYFSGTALALR